MRVFKNYGAAFLYFAAYFAVQVIVILGFFAYYAIGIMNTGITDYVSITNLMMMKVENDTMLITAVSNLLYVLLVFIFFVVRKKSFFREIGVAKLSLRTVVASLSIGAALNILVSFVMNFIPFPEKWWDAYVESSSSLSEDVTALTVFLAVVAAPIAEEILFRGLILGTLKQEMHPWAAILLSSLAFGAAHGTAISFIYATGIGLLMGWLFVKFDSVLPSIIFHMAYNCTLAYSGNINGIIALLSIPIMIITIKNIKKIQR